MFFLTKINCCLLSYLLDSCFFSFFSPPQVEDSQGLPLSIEKNDSHCPPSKLGLKRQTAAAHLRGQYQASVRQKKANQAKQKHAEQREDANNAAFSGMQPSLQTTLHPQKAYTRTLPQPYTSPQYYSSSDSHFPLSSTFDVFKVCCNIHVGVYI